MKEWMTEKQANAGEFTM